ncbi:MAG TPA: hypothetical protein VF152_15010 [Acidimicrobiia bacterium]
MGRRRRCGVYLGLLVGALVVAAACGGDDSGANAGDDDGSDTTAAPRAGECELVTTGDVEAAFGGRVEAVAAPADSPEGTCIFAVEDSDAGGDGQVAVVPDQAGDDPVEGFELFCQVEEAEEIAGAGDRACYTRVFQELFVLVGDEIFLIRAPIGEFFEDAEPAQLEESFVALGQAVAASG